MVERDVDVQAFEILNLSRDFESSFVVNELDPTLWFNIVSDESEIKYATTQLPLDYRDLHDAIGGEPLDAAIAILKRSGRSSRRCWISFMMPICCACAAGEFSPVHAGFSATGVASSNLDQSMRLKRTSGRIRVDRSVDSIS
ncbi:MULTISPECIES: hypothetical protein [unclassified Mesorhizobium]|uniref:hypothetical protein n=1 Tax=unclassified Mesorhizobium TaxID=325217 RepID=UPI001CCE988C|nr:MULTISPECIES: hypothetical protein [unclassified Mesorhizobium]MBZ9811161.1 hypothetical protein [Mesorhizobium sp. ESP-6-2]